VEVHQVFDVQAPPASVYDSLNDVGEIGHCVSGVTAVEVLSDTESRWKVEQKLGYIARTFTLNAKITNARRPELIEFAAAADDVNVNGRMKLQPAASNATTCALTMNVEVQGPLAPIVELFAKGPQQALITETIANLRAKLEEKYGGPGVAPAAAPKRGFFARLRALFNTKERRTP
jgi:carbon monoxide dehydrogenase subunit G